jgi:hypothetical protein
MIAPTDSDQLYALQALQSFRNGFSGNSFLATAGMPALPAALDREEDDETMAKREILLEDSNTMPAEKATFDAFMDAKLEKTHTVAMNAGTNQRNVKILDKIANIIESAPATVKPRLQVALLLLTTFHFDRDTNIFFTGAFKAFIGKCKEDHTLHRTESAEGMVTIACAYMQSLSMRVADRRPVVLMPRFTTNWDAATCDQVYASYESLIDWMMCASVTASDVVAIASLMGQLPAVPLLVGVYQDMTLDDVIFAVLQNCSTFASLSGKQSGRTEPLRLLLGESWLASFARMCYNMILSVVPGDVCPSLEDMEHLLTQMGGSEGDGGFVRLLLQETNMDALLESAAIFQQSASAFAPVVAADVAPVAADVAPVAAEVAADEVAPVAAEVAVDEPAPVAAEVAVDEPAPVAAEVAVDEPAPVAADEPAPVAAALVETLILDKDETCGKRKAAMEEEEEEDDPDQDAFIRECVRKLQQQQNAEEANAPLSPSKRSRPTSDSEGETVDPNDPDMVLNQKTAPTREQLQDGWRHAVREYDSNDYDSNDYDSSENA